MTRGGIWMAIYGAWGLHLTIHQLQTHSQLHLRPKPWLETPQSWLVPSPKKNNVYCTLGDHCTTIFEPNELKSMRFWKSFESSFRWDQPNLYALKCIEFINSQSSMFPLPKKSIFTVLWEITVMPFLNKMGWNLWDSERVLKDLSGETNRICML